MMTPGTGSRYFGGLEISSFLVKVTKCDVEHNSIWYLDKNHLNLNVIANKKSVHIVIQTIHTHTNSLFLIIILLL